MGILFRIVIDNGIYDNNTENNSQNIHIIYLVVNVFPACKIHRA